MRTEQPSSSSVSSGATTPPSPSLAVEQAFVIRQPVVDVASNLYGYEISAQPGLTTQTPSQTARRLFDTAVNGVGLASLLAGKKLFVDVPQEVLLSGDFAVLPPEQTIVIVDGTSELSAEVLTACETARRSGFQLATRCRTAAPYVLVDLADYLVIDVRDADHATGAAKVEVASKKHKRVVVTNVETRDQLHKAQALGASLFQGYFFCEPEALRSRTLARSETSCLRLVAELNKPQLDLSRVEQVIKSDAALSYNLLKFLNSAALGVSNRVTSIRQAMVLLGERPLRKWGSLAALNSLGVKRPPQVLVTCLVRAYFCEGLAASTGRADSAFDYFMTGLLSLLDVILEMPMREALAALPLNESVQKVLLGDVAGELGGALEVVVAVERGAWNSVNRACVQHHWSSRELASKYYEALALVNSFSGS